jgi:hypothetical protein
MRNMLQIGDADASVVHTQIVHTRNMKDNRMPIGVIGGGTAYSFLGEGMSGIR